MRNRCYVQRVDWIITGASRGIGRALALALTACANQGDRIFALARDGQRLRTLAAAAEGLPGEVVTFAVDLARLDGARRAGEALAAEVCAATLIHNAGLWPTRLELVDGFEAGFATNCLGPLVLQQAPLVAKRVSRVLVISAGLLVKGRFDPGRTPFGRDFSAFRTYCTTKLAGAVAMRDQARRFPEVDFAVVHPGVVNTDLGATRGALGWVMKLVKRSWESPEACAARVLRLLQRPRWSHSPGDAPWFFEESEQPWPPVVDRVHTEIVASVEQCLLPSLRAEATASLRAHRQRS
jgi:NAD(P)-dependent dehydrogenase (short-subunit alcohol dehydrogenase family)